MKKMFKKIKEWFVWMKSKKVLDAINDGASYDEVLGIIRVVVNKK